MAWPTHVTVAILAQGTLRAVAVMQAFSEFVGGSSHVGGALVLRMMCGVCGGPPCVHPSFGWCLCFWCWSGRLPVFRVGADVSFLCSNKTF